MFAHTYLCCLEGVPYVNEFQLLNCILLGDLAGLALVALHKQDPTVDIHQYLRTSDDIETAIEYSKLRPWSIKLSRFEITNDSDRDISPFVVVRLED